jgi:hypothetical protein
MAPLVHPHASIGFKGDPPMTQAQRSDYNDRSPMPQARTFAIVPATLPIGDHCMTPGHTSQGEERISIFWRVFGGAILSIAGLVLITIYQGLNNTLNELRNDVVHLNESRADLMKKDEFNTRSTLIWNSMKEMNAGITGLAGLRDRSALLEQQLKVAEDERKALALRVDELRLKIATLEGRQASTRPEKAATRSDDKGQ